MSDLPMPASAPPAPTLPDSPTQEWSYLHPELYWIACGICFAFIAGLYFLQTHLLTDVQINLLTLGMLSAAVSSYALYHLSPRWASRLLVAGLGATVLAVQALAPGYDLGVLLLLPPLLATLTLSARAGLAAAGVTAALLALPPMRSQMGLNGEEAGAVLLTVALCMLIFWLAQRRQRSLLAGLYGQYCEAAAQLEGARDQRLALNQANRSLSEAYFQLQRLNKLHHQAVLEAELARRAKEDFVANVSHELRTPLNMIIGFSEMILFSPTTYGRKLPATLLSDMGVIHRNSRHLAQLINDVLDLSQTESGQLTLSRDWTNAVDIVHEAAAAVTPLFRAKNLGLTVETSQERIELLCDRLRIRQILLNLLSNAGRHTQRGGAVVGVAVLQEEAIITVRDTGPGIAEEEHERIFEPFYQASKTTDGTGLGLSISKRLVEAHGGRMWVESRPGDGAAFFCALPLMPEQAAGSAALRWVNDFAFRGLVEKPTLPPLPPSNERVLFVTKEAELGDQMQALFNEVELVRVGQLDDIAVQVEQYEPNAVLINEMRVMADKEFTRRVLANLPRHMPIISCYLPGKQEACDYLNVIEYLVKPVTRAKLNATLEQHAAAGSTVLLVEDNAEMARLLRRQITAAAGRHRVLHAGDGAAALRLMCERLPDLVMLDLGLPDQDGYQLLELKNNNPAIAHIPVIIVSARDPLGEPLVADRLRIELAGGLTLRDIARCTTAITRALAPAAKPVSPAPPEKSPDPLASE